MHARTRNEGARPGPEDRRLSSGGRPQGPGPLRGGREGVPALPPAGRELMRLRDVAAGLSVLMVVGMAGGVWFARSHGSRATARPPAAATADIKRGDLIDTTTVDGLLTYADERKIVGAAAGTVTGIAAADSVIEQGAAL